MNSILVLLVKIPSETPPGIPGYSWIIIISLIAVGSVIYAKKKSLNLKFFLFSLLSNLKPYPKLN